MILAFHYAAVLSGAWYAFTSWDGVRSPHFVGFSNFREIFQDPVARAALLHSVEITAAFVVISNVIGLALALALHRAVKTRNFLRLAFFAPVVMSPLAVSYIWQFIFQYTGPLNGLLAGIGLGSARNDWLADPTFALWMVLVVLIWQFAGLTMTFYLAGLQGIPDELDEAAAIDGASGWFRLRKLTLPLLAPAMTVSMTFTAILGLRLFDQVIALTGGGPGSTTETLATRVYVDTFVNSRFGYGAALALVLTALVAIVATSQLIVLRQRERRL